MKTVSTFKNQTNSFTVEQLYQLDLMATALDLPRAQVIRNALDDYFTTFNKQFKLHKENTNENNDF